MKDLQGSAKQVKEASATLRQHLITLTRQQLIAFAADRASTPSTALDAALRNIGRTLLLDLYQEKSTEEPL